MYEKGRWRADGRLSLFLPELVIVAIVDVETFAHQPFRGRLNLVDNFRVKRMVTFSRISRASESLRK
jgi:hypothetical protein